MDRLVSKTTVQKMVKSVALAFHPLGSMVLQERMRVEALAIVNGMS